MDSTELKSRLNAGGIPDSELTGETNHVSPYCALMDPTGAEALGRALAEQVKAFGPTKVLVWEGPDVNVLGHVVARELGVTAARALDASGVLDLDGTIGQDRVVVIADAVRATNHVVAMRALAERNGGQLVGFGVLVGTPALRESADGANTVVLVGDDDTGAPR